MAIFLKNRAGKLGVGSFSNTQKDEKLMERKIEKGVV